MAAVIGALRVNLGLNSAEFEQGMKKAQGALGGISKAFAALGGVALFAGFTAGIGAAVGRIEEMRKLTAQLDQALANTGNTANTSGKEVEQFADRLERSTGRAAEEVMAVSTNLATFGFNRQVFFEAIELADDMSAAWGGDLKQNVEGLSRALADPEKGLAMLTKRGITFTDQQKAMIAGFMKSNDLLGAQGVILDTLQEQVSGVAEAGYDKLTKAQANSGIAAEGLFEKLTLMLGVNSGLEMSFLAIAATLDFVTDNLELLARAAAVAGSAIAVALGPSVWAAVSAAAVAMSTTVVGGIRAIGVAIAANPIGLIIAALAAAVTAAFLFRDEIKQAIGIDFVGIIQGAANNTIGLFVGAYKAIVAAWDLLPAAFGDIFTRAMNGSIDIVQNGVNGIVGALRNIPGLGGLSNTDLSGFKREETGALNNVGGVVQSAFGQAFSVDYLGELGKMLGLVGEEATGATADIAGLGIALDGTGTGGGAAGGAKALGTAADETKGKLAGLGDMGNSVTSALKDGFKDLFKGLITGSGNAMDAVSSLLGKLGDLFLDQGFNMLFSGFGGGASGGGLFGGLFSGIGKLFGFARGGTIMPGGSGGIDSQLVTFRKSPNERVDITKPGQSLSSGGGGEIKLSGQFEVVNGNLVPLVTQVSGQVAGQQIKANNKQIPNIMRDHGLRNG